MVTKGSVVLRDGLRWLVTEISPAVGGGSVAQLECLERDAHAAVDVARLDDVLPLVPGQIDALRAKRDAAEAPKRTRHAIRMHERRIARAEAANAKLKAATAEAKARLDAGDMRAIENREIVPGQVVSIAPAALVKLCEDAIRGNEAQIARSKADRDADVAALEKMGG